MTRTIVMFGMVAVTAAVAGYVLGHRTGFDDCERACHAEPIGVIQQPLERLPASSTRSRAF